MVERNALLLEVENLKTFFFTNKGLVKAVDGVSFSLGRGETLGLVGESGSGKTMTSLSILRLVPFPGRTVAGAVRFQGEDLLQKNRKEIRKYRGSRIAMIPQDPMTSLNPVYRIGNQIGEPLSQHQHLSGKTLTDRVRGMLELVRIPSPQKRLREYPHQFSGGMKQRAMIAMSLSCRPDLIIADEPTTALDVTIQAQILLLLKELQQEFHTAILFITHDLGVVAQMCSRVAVMYAGNIVEQADVRAIFKTPRHPYTRGLIRSVPKMDDAQEHLYTIEGQPPNLLRLPQGCAFSPRCPHAEARCRLEKPQDEYADEEHLVRCLRWKEL
jgi:oligopeptide/dipeptide ABC transporter ATP-binding protein